MPFDEWTTAGLWLAVVGSGIYHGINPGMGWPLAFSAGVMGRRQRDLLIALGPLAIGHLFAMLGILMPFAIMASLIDWQTEIRIATGLLVIAMGTYLLIYRRHPRFLSRIRPTQLVLWSFAVATAHGAGLMLLPIYLGLCSANELDAGHGAVAQLMSNDLGGAIAVSVVHTLTMVITGGLVAWAVFRWVGPQFISRSWFNLDIVWALSLILVGGAGVVSAL